MPEPKPKYQLGDMVKECRREHGQRRVVYARLVAAGKMTQEEADRRMGLMEGVANALQWLSDNNEWIREENRKRTT